MAFHRLTYVFYFKRYVRTRHLKIFTYNSHKIYCICKTCSLFLLIIICLEIKKKSVIIILSLLLVCINIQVIHRRMVPFQKLTRNLFLTLHGHNIHCQQRQLSKFLIRYEQFASHAYCGVAWPVSKMASQ